MEHCISCVPVGTQSRLKVSSFLLCSLLSFPYSPCVLLKLPLEEWQFFFIPCLSSKYIWSRLWFCSYTPFRFCLELRVRDSMNSDRQHKIPNIWKMVWTPLSIERQWSSVRLTLNTALESRVANHIASKSWRSRVVMISEAFLNTRFTVLSKCFLKTMTISSCHDESHIVHQISKLQVVGSVSF